MNKIDKEQLNKLLKIIRNDNIMFEWIYGVCNISCLTDMTVRQYNNFLALIEQKNNSVVGIK